MLILAAVRAVDFLFSYIADAEITRKIFLHLGNEEWNANTRVKAKTGE